MNTERPCRILRLVPGKLAKTGEMGAGKVGNREGVCVWREENTE